MKKESEFDRKSVEKYLFARFMPTAPDKRRMRRYLRKSARDVERACRIGRRDGISGKALISWDALQHPENSEIGMSISRLAYSAYCAGHESGALERWEME